MTLNSIKKTKCFISTEDGKIKSVSLRFKAIRCSLIQMSSVLIGKLGPSLIQQCAKWARDTVMEWDVVRMTFSNSQQEKMHLSIFYQLWGQELNQLSTGSKDTTDWHMTGCVTNATRCWNLYWRPACRHRVMADEQIPLYVCGTIGAGARTKQTWGPCQRL